MLLLDLNFSVSFDDVRGSGNQMKGRAWPAGSSKEVSHFTVHVHHNKVKQRDPPSTRPHDADRQRRAFAYQLVRRTKHSSSDSVPNEFDVRLYQSSDLESCESHDQIRPLWIRVRVEI